MFNKIDKKKNRKSSLTILIKKRSTIWFILLYSNINFLVNRTPSIACPIKRSLQRKNGWIIQNPVFLCILFASLPTKKRLTKKKGRSGTKKTEQQEESDRNNLRSGGISSGWDEHTGIGKRTIKEKQQTTDLTTSSPQEAHLLPLFFPFYITHFHWPPKIVKQSYFRRFFAYNSFCIRL